MEIITLLKNFGYEIEKVKRQNPSYYSYRDTYDYYLISDEKKDFDSNPIYFKVDLPSREGSIGRVVGFESLTYSDYQQPEKNIIKSNPTYLLKFDKENKVLKFDYYQAVMLSDYKGPTVYKFTAKKPGKTIIKPKVNKFHQELLKDLLIVGNDISKRLVIRLCF